MKKLLFASAVLLAPALTLPMMQAPKLASQLRYCIPAIGAKRNLIDIGPIVVGMYAIGKNIDNRDKISKLTKVNPHTNHENFSLLNSAVINGLASFTAYSMMIDPTCTLSYACPVVAAAMIAYNNSLAAKTLETANALITEHERDKKRVINLLQRETKILQDRAQELNKKSI